MTDEDYLPCSSYENQAAHPVETGFSAFFNESNSLYFFAMLDADGKVLLKSEGYPQQAARENGIQSVIKNRVNKDFYSVKSEDGKYFLSLRAANYREIARSCSVDSEAAALELIPYATGEKVRGGQQAAALTTKERANDKVDDDYLACKEYEGKPDVGIDGYAGLVKFTHESGLHYFAWYDDDSNLLMRSEGYPTTAARDNGMASVAKNRDLEERYSTIEKVGRHFVILKAGNHQEIARSCGYDSAAAAMALYPSARAKAAEEKAASLAAAAAAAALAATPASADTSDSNRREDNYLACRDYEGHGTADENGIIKFQHSDGQHYFAWLNADGSVKMRSEGYPTTAARDNGADSVVRNRDNEARYSSTQVGSKHFTILKAGNHQEIARSCASDTPFAWANWLLPAAAIAAVPLAATAEEVIPPAAPVVETTPDVEDDYMPCREYEGRTVNDRVNNVALFKHDNGQYYFAVYNADGSVRLRSEGFRTAIDRDKELSGVLKNLNNEDMYTILKRGDYFIRILKDKTGREVGRSCLLKEEPKPVVVVPPPVVPEPEVEVPSVAPLAAVGAAALGAAALIPEIEEKIEIEEPKVVVPPPPPPPVYAAAAPVVEETAAAAGGFNWWWLLPLLLLPLLWFFWKGCNKETAAVTTPAVTTAPVPPIVVDTVKSTAPVPDPAVAAKAAAASCDLNWIFFDFDKADLRTASQEELDALVKILKDNPDYVAVLKANTDWKGSDAYNEALSTRRANNSKAYLVKKGIDAARIKTSMNGEKDPIAKNAVGNSDSEQGRQFNRRVELYVQNKAGKNVCESIPPTVPEDLKVK